MATGHMTNRDRPTLLLVEDDAATRGFLGDNLYADGYEIVAAQTAADGLRQLGIAFPDVAIVDAQPAAWLGLLCCLAMLGGGFLWWDRVAHPRA